MNIKHDSWLSDKDIERIETKMKATYICDLPLKDSNKQYINMPFAIFYAEEKHPEGSNWFALYFDLLGRTKITNAKELENKIITALRKDNDIVYSSYRHDFQQLGKSFIDGGLDYCRLSIHNNECEKIELQVTKDGLKQITK